MGINKEKIKSTMYKQFISWLRPKLCGREPRIAFVGNVEGQNAKCHAGCYAATKLRCYSIDILACHFSIPYFLIGSSLYTFVSSDIRGFSAYRAQPSVKAV